MEFNTASSNSNSRLLAMTLLPPKPEEVLLHRSTLHPIQSVLPILSLPVKPYPASSAVSFTKKQHRHCFPPSLNGNMMSGAVAAAFQPRE